MDAEETETTENLAPSMAAEEAQAEIVACKLLLAQSDYQALKHADGALTDEEYAEMRAKRARWRDRVNQCEALLAQQADAGAQGDAESD